MKWLLALLFLIAVPTWLVWQRASGADAATALVVLQSEQVAKALDAIAVAQREIARELQDLDELEQDPGQLAIIANHRALLVRIRDCMRDETKLLSDAHMTTRSSVTTEALGNGRMALADLREALLLEFKVCDELEQDPAHREAAARLRRRLTLLQGIAEMEGRHLAVLEQAVAVVAPAPARSMRTWWWAFWSAILAFAFVVKVVAEARR